MAKRRVIDHSAWTAATTAHQLLRLLFPRERSAKAAGPQRKLRLLACAWARRMPELQRPHRQIIEAAERFADGLAPEDELFKALNGYEEAYGLEGNDPAFGPCCVATYNPIDCYWFWTEAADQCREGLLPDLIRDLFPGPSAQPVKVPKAWRAATVTAIARGCYDDRAFDRLPILADALEDAGCADEPFLTHLRGPGPHVRGCWAVDAVLGL